MPNGSCPHCHAPVSHRGGGLFSTLFKVALLYVGMVFTAGTLIKTGHPVAVEAGRLMHTVTFIDPAIRWTAGNGFGVVSHGLQVLADGARFS